MSFFEPPPLPPEQSEHDEPDRPEWARAAGERDWRAVLVVAAPAAGAAGLRQRAAGARNPLTRSEVDASLVRDAAEQAEIIWPRVPSARGCGWSVRSYGAGSKDPPGQSV